MQLECNFENYLAQFCIDNLAQEVLGSSIGNRVQAKLQTDLVDPASFSSGEWNVSSVSLRKIILKHYAR